jgi:hypothetical protein
VNIMNLVKWLRKNNTKIMAVVVIVILFGFIGGSALRYLLQPRRGLGKTIAYFGEGEKITNRNMLEARRELEILNMLRCPDILRTLDLHGVFLSELLFSERIGSPALTARIKQAIRVNRYRISDRQISDIYTHTIPRSIYWLLLNKEAQTAGIGVSDEEVGQLLGQAVPQLFQGQTYSQIMAFMMNRLGVSEQQILSTFGKLMAVWQYAQLICLTENVTESQIRHMISWEEETIDVEFVRLDSAVFADIQEPPGEEKILEHFNKYKRFFAGEVSDENPYGFGYKLSDRAQLEYIVVKLDDISRLITDPTQEEVEEYYQRNRDRLFTTEVPSDPNDPNSPLIKQVRSYAEVADMISSQLLRDKINLKAEQILNEAKLLVEAPLEGMEVDREVLSPDQIKDLLGNYHDIAEQLADKYKVKIYAGQTGLLRAADMHADKYLGTLCLMSPGYNPVRLSHLVFSIEQLHTVDIVLSGVREPKLYENIGPVKNPFGRMAKDMSGQIIALVRVIKAQKAGEPENIDQVFSTETLELGQNPPAESESIFSVREKVIEDLKKLAALETTKRKAEEFTKLAADKGWESALDEFNGLYGQAGRDSNDPNVFKLENLIDMQRIPNGQLGMMALHNSDNPISSLLHREAEARKQFVDLLYSLVPSESDSAEVPLIIEFKPNMSYYVIRSISIQHLDQQEYEKIKAMRLSTEDYIQSQSLAAVYFNPENILKRMKFRSVEQSKDQGRVSGPSEREDES